MMLSDLVSPEQLLLCASLNTTEGQVDECLLRLTPISEAIRTIMQDKPVIPIGRLAEVMSIVALLDICIRMSSEGKVN